MIVRNSIIVIGLLLMGYISWNVYHYFFDTHEPHVIVKGLESDGYYANEMQCTLEGSDAYKITNIAVFLDGKPLITSYKINSKTFSHPFTITTKALSNGKHHFKAEAANGIHASKTAVCEMDFYVDNMPLQAAFLKPEIDCKVFQGRTLHIQFQVNKEIQKATVFALSNLYDCFKEAKNSPIYECFIPITCEEKPTEYLLTFEVVDRVGNVLRLEQKFQVILYPFKKQVLNIAPEKIKEEIAAGLSAQLLEAQIDKLTKQSPKEKLWQGAFIAPIDIKGISTDFGTIRTTQERGRYMHKAVDVLNTPKSVIWASQGGVVVLKDRFEYSGNTLIIDHGFGILSLFFHLDSFADINVGDFIKQGNPIGTMGKTGYASGYHLHWEMRVGNIPVDPMQWIKPNF